MRNAQWLLPLGVAVLAVACRTPGEARSELATVLAEREARLARAMAGDSAVNTDAPVARWILPENMREISGLALTGDDRLLVHGDEVATVFEIDYRRGTIVKEFNLGSPVIQGDFEALTRVADTLFMLTSDGMLYRFLEGEPGTAVRYTRRDTNLGERCEFEGMAFDSAANALVLACKNIHDERLDDAMVLFRWPLAADSTGAAPTPELLLVPEDLLIGTRNWERIEPSDIAVDPVSGNYIIIASRQFALIVITPAGEVLRSETLPPGHPQAEGLAITSDGIMLVSDEATTEPAVITAYRWQP